MKSIFLALYHKNINKSLIKQKFELNGGYFLNNTSSLENEITIKKTFDFKELKPLRTAKNILISITNKDWGGKGAFLIEKLLIRAALGGGKKLSNDGKISICFWGDGSSHPIGKSILSTKKLGKYYTFVNILKDDFIVETGDYPIYIKEKGDINQIINFDDVIFIELINATGRILQKSWETDIIDIFLIGKNIC